MDQEGVNAKMTVIRTVDEAQGTPKRKKVAILGFTETWKLAPFDDPEFEIWGLNELYQFIPRWDRWFEIHSRAAYEADKKRIDDHVGRLKQMTCPIYMQQHWEDIPNSVPYPLDAVSKAFPNPAGDSWRPYLTNSISYMIALAILENVGEIHIYGVDMSHDTEYGHQKPSCEYYVGVAQGRGIKVYVPPQADLLKTVFLYGFEEEQAIGFDQKLHQRLAEYKGKLVQLQADTAQRNEAIQQYLGAIQDTEQILKNWRPELPQR